MRTRLRGKVTLLFMTCAVILLVFPAMASAQGAPTIQSDKGDYRPGELVTLTGSGWQPGESVRIVVNDTFGATWQHTADVTADDSGNITDSFNLPDWFVSDYDVTATGAQSGTATTTFTDGNATVTGRVTDSVSGQGISGATVTCGTSSGCNNNVSATTNASGNYSLPVNFPGNEATLTLTVSKSGYTNNTRTVNVPNNNVTVANQNVVLTASNQAPVIASDNASRTVNEGQTATNTGTWSDANSGQNVTLSASVGTVTKAGTNASGTWSWSYTPNDGPANQTVTITANDGTTTSTTSFQLTVNNVAPTVVLTGDTSANEGQTKTYTYTVNDPGNDPNPTITESCGTGGTKIDTLAANSFECTFPDGPASPTVEVTADDGDPTNNIGSDSIEVTVANVAPTVVLSGDTSANEGQTKTYTYTVNDPGQDTFTTNESCGANGNYTDTAAANSFECTFPDGPATSTVSVSANDGDDTGNDSIEVTVANVAPTLNGLTASSENVLAGSVNKVIFTANASDVSGDTITYTWSGGDASSSTATGNTYKAGFSSCGDKIVTVTASDGDGGSAQMTKTVKAWNAIFQAPIKDGSVNTSAKGQVVPVKASIGCGTNNLTTLQPAIQLLNGDATPEADSGTTALTTSVGSLADTGPVMRPVDAGYIYNLLTPSAAAGTKYTIRVNPWGATPPAGTTPADWNLATGMYALLQIRSK
jgi:CarboxypepD_reg-like domain/PKD domain